MTHGSLFTGIGMWDYSLAKMGVTTSWSAEIDEFCRQILTKRFPSAYQYESVEAVNLATHATPVDIISAGWPCQDLSEASMTGEWLSGQRSGLWSEVVRIVSEFRPKLVLLENVAILRSRGLHTVLQDLNSLGYNADWDVIAAADVGAPHIRERLWIAAWEARLRPLSGYTFTGLETPKTGAMRGCQLSERTSVVAGVKRPKPRWPTPTYADGYGGPGRQGREGGMNLRTAIRNAGHLGPPNPEFVEWLMGIPVGWTDLSRPDPVMWSWNYKTVFPPPTVAPRSVERRGWRVGAVGNSHVPAVAELFSKPYVERII